MLTNEHICVTIWLKQRKAVRQTVHVAAAGDGKNSKNDRDNRDIRDDWDEEIRALTPERFPDPDTLFAEELSALPTPTGDVTK